MVVVIVLTRAARTVFGKISTEKIVLCTPQNVCCTGFTISPGNNWVLEVGREYEITVHIFDKINHRVIVTEVWCIACPFWRVIDVMC